MDDLSRPEIEALLAGLSALGTASHGELDAAGLTALRDKLEGEMPLPEAERRRPVIHQVQWVRQDGVLLMEWIQPEGTAVYPDADPYYHYTDKPVFVRYRELPDGAWVKGYWFPEGYPGDADHWPEGMEIEERSPGMGGTPAQDRPDEAPSDGTQVILESLRLGRERVTGTDPNVKAMERSRFALMEERITHWRQGSLREQLVGPPSLGRPTAAELRELLGDDPGDAGLRQALAAWQDEERGGIESEPDPADIPHDGSDDRLREGIAPDGTVD